MLEVANLMLVVGPDAREPSSTGFTGTGGGDNGGQQSLNAAPQGTLVQ